MSDAQHSAELVIQRAQARADADSALNPAVATGASTEPHRSAAGDPRGSFQYNLKFDCPALDAYRMALENGVAATPPAPQQECPPTFGNSDIADLRRAASAPAASPARRP